MIRKLFKNMLLAQIMSSVAVTICMLVDSMMIGQFLGVDAIAAYGLASPVLLLFAAIGSMISTGIQVICSRCMAAGDKEGTNKCFTASLVVSGAVSVIGMLIILFYSGPICGLLGATRGTVVFDMTQDYLKGFLIGTPAFLAAQIFVPYMQISNNRTKLVLSVSIMSVADIILDLLNVKVFEGGIFGMGLASAISYYAAVVLAVIYFCSEKSIFKFSLKGLKKADCANLFKHGMPTVVNQICYALQIFTVNQILITAGSSDGVAVYSILSTMGNLCFSVGSGIGSVALTLSGIFYVEEDRHSLEGIVRIITKYAIVVDVIVTGVIFAASPLIVKTFLGDANTPIEMASFALRIFALCFIPASLNTSFKNYYQGIGKIWLNQLISVLQNFVYVSAAAFFLNTIFGVNGVWFAFVSGELLTLVSLAGIIWRKTGHVSFKAEDFAFLSKDFGVGEENLLEFSVSDVNQISACSSEASRFCNERVDDERRSMFVALCIEEMASNVLKHGFKDGGVHTVDIRLCYKQENLILSIRDDGERFNPVKYMKHQNEEAADANVTDPDNHFGIKMVFSMASDVKYVNTLGLNNLTITI